MSCIYRKSVSKIKLKGKESRIDKTIQNKKNWRLTLPDFKAYLQLQELKQCGSGWKDIYTYIHTNEDSLKNPEIDPHKYGQLNFYKSTK